MRFSQLDLVQNQRYDCNGHYIFCNDTLNYIHGFSEVTFVEKNSLF